jgi:RNA polymerase sigma factor (sigma-70 family)
MTFPGRDLTKPGDGSVTHWLNQLATADDSVAERELFDRYFGKLIGVARQKLSASRRAVEDEEDLALSAMDSFLRRAADGQFPKLSDRDELWSLLVTIVTRKAVNRFKKDRALKRGGGGQFGHDGDACVSSLAELVAAEPAPEMLAELREELHHRLNLLEDDTLRDVALLRLQGFTNLEIAQRLGVAERTVRRKINRIRREWTEDSD